MRVQEEEEENLRRRDRLIRRTIAFVLFVAIVFVIVDSFTTGYCRAVILSFIEWIQKNPGFGVLAVILVYIFATVLFIPGSILTIGTGFAFGSAFDNTAMAVILSSVAVFIGAVLGSMSSFLLGRYLFRDCVTRLVARYVIFEAIDRALEENGLKIMILLRLSPLIPYNALDYLSGLTSISFWSYSLALVAMLPGVVAFCFLGATASTLTSTDENETVKIVTLVIGVVFAVAGVVAASYYSKLELEKILREREERDETSPTILGPIT